jgi:hypothetical protein
MCQIRLHEIKEKIHEFGPLIGLTSKRRASVIAAFRETANLDFGP